MPPDVKEAINKYKRDINPHENLAKPIPIDQFGRALGVGRRKSSTARAYLGRRHRGSTYQWENTCGGF
ncbi:hypothetical protein EYC84_003441 [Monilinia fructicola]|uniref:Uncharacterized protein n=1 Tax=Monilinia fructicola TaxID=38448 RepID=A0A5M9JYA5_MONFR|nr:hypothetical protein EYC84_003441 [Monilinia fructicola]